MRPASPVHAIARRGRPVHSQRAACNSAREAYTLQCKVSGTGSVHARPRQGARRHRQHPPAAGRRHDVPRLRPGGHGRRPARSRCSRPSPSRSGSTIRPATRTCSSSAGSLPSAASAALIGAEMIARTRRHHSDLADAMILNAIEQFLPAGAAGVAIALVLLAVRARLPVDAAGPVADAGEPRPVRRGAVPAAHRGARRRLVLRRGRGRADPGEPDARAVALGSWACRSPSGSSCSRRSCTSRSPTATAETRRIRAQR